MLKVLLGFPPAFTWILGFLPCMCKDVAPDSRGKPAKSVELTAFLVLSLPKNLGFSSPGCFSRSKFQLFFSPSKEIPTCFLVCLLVRVSTYFYVTSQTLTFETEELPYAVKEVAAWRMLNFPQDPYFLGVLTLQVLPAPKTPEQQASEVYLIHLF